MQYTKQRNKVKQIVRNDLKEEQNIAQQYKSNPKKFWKYVNSKTKRTERIGDLKVNKNSSGDEIANVNFLRRYGTYVLQNTKKREPTSFNQLDDS